MQNKIEKIIMWGDLDSLGIVYYPRYYEWIDGCSHQFFKKIGIHLVDLWKMRQLQFGLVRTSCDYFSPGRYLQEIIISTHIEKLEEKTVTIRHSISNKSDYRVMVSGIEKRICIIEQKPGDMRACKIPDDLYQILEKAI